MQSIERLIKTAIVDKTPSVSSAALVSSYHLLPVARDVVRRWQSETQEAASSSKQSIGFLGFSSSQAHPISQSNYMTQYHAIGLLYQMRAHDRMALVKMVQQYGAAGVLKSPAALVLLVRLAAKLAEEDQGLRKPMMQMLDGWLRHKHEMVNFEAAKAICDMRDVTDGEASQAVHVLQLFLSSPRPITKFAAIRILHNFASFKPNVVAVCNPDIESLISNTNRSIATFAITTLLKTGNEASVDRLMKQISGFMADITDEFKITIVEAIRTLCLKFPSEQAGMLSFLSGILRDEGGYEFKRSVVESMFDLIKFVPESKEEGMSHSVLYGSADIISARASLRVHRGLRVHQALGQDIASSWRRGPKDLAPDQVYSVYLQQSSFGKRHCQGRRCHGSCQVRRWTEGSGSEVQCFCSPHTLSG